MIIPDIARDLVLLARDQRERPIGTLARGEAVAEALGRLVASGEVADLGERESANGRRANFYRLVVQP
jgi:hypothetical protein